jgi:hypothetical protein
MSQKIQVELIDDIDGTPAEETVYFGLDGKSYEIDLSSDNSKHLREGLTEWITAARKAGTHRAARKAPTPRKAASATSAVRVWAGENGYQLAERGRIPAAVQAAYEAANE